MNIAILDDEKSWAIELMSMINMVIDSKTKNELSLYSSGQKLLNKIIENNSCYDLIFLDIYLNEELDGITLARHLRKSGCNSHIVFVTSSQDFALIQRSFEVKADHYLIKPVSEIDLKALFVRMENENMFMYSSKKVHYAIPLKNILFIESKRNYIQINCIDRSQNPDKIRGKLSDYVNGLPKTFVQCHRSYFVNIINVSKLKDNKAFFDDGTSVNMGGKYINSVIDSFFKWK